MFFMVSCVHRSKYGQWIKVAQLAREKRYIFRKTRSLAILKKHKTIASAYVYRNMVQYQMTLCLCWAFTFVVVVVVVWIAYQDYCQTMLVITMLHIKQTQSCITMYMLMYLYGIHSDSREGVFEWMVWGKPQRMNRSFVEIVFAMVVFATNFVM